MKQLLRKLIIDEVKERARAKEKSNIEAKLHCTVREKFEVKVEIELEMRAKLKQPNKYGCIL